MAKLKTDHPIKYRVIRKVEYTLARWRNTIPQGLCGIFGGHLWWDWQPQASYNLMHDRTVHFMRRCQMCDKQEYFRATDDNMPANEPNRFF